MSSFIFGDKIDLDKLIPERLKALPGEKLQYCFIGIISVLVLVCVVLGVFLGLGTGGVLELCIPEGQLGPEFAPITAQACTRTECLETAARLSENLDTSVDPCEDFHQYACGRWGERNSIPPGEKELTTMKKMLDENDERIREILEAPISSSETGSSERKLKKFYTMCLHDYGRMRDSSKDFLDLVQRYLHGWYAQDPDNWQNNGWNLNDAIATVQGELNVNVLLRVNVGMFWRSKKPVIMLYSGGTGMNYRNYLRTDDRAVKVQEAYKDYMRTVVRLLLRDANVTATVNVTDVNERVEQFVSDAYGQEAHLAQLLLDLRSSGVRGMYRPRTITLGDLESNYTQLPWREVIQRAFEGFHVTDETHVRLSPYGYFLGVDQLLQNETTHRDRIMNNYIVWEMVHTYGRYLSWEYKYSILRYYEVAFGSKSLPSTWRQCVWLAKTRTGAALTAEFLMKYANYQSQEQVENMFGHLQSALYNSIERLHWMDNDTKPIAEDKVTLMNHTVGFPKVYFSQPTIEELYNKLEINENMGFFKNLLNVERYRRHIRTLQIHSGKYYYTWRFVLYGGSGGATSRYDWRTNYILVPPGAMQFPLFQKNNPYFMNFGGLGSQMANQMSISIGNQGRYVLSNGTIKNWWTAESYSNYLKSASCFATDIEGLILGPFLVKGENRTVVVSGRYQTKRLVDLVAGLRTSLKAYHDWASEFGPEQMPVGLNLTPDQAFFVSAAQTQCFIRNDEFAYRKARYQYLPENLLLNGALGHMPEFAKVFQCNVNSTMVASNTCNVF